MSWCILFFLMLIQGNSTDLNSSSRLWQIQFVGLDRWAYIGAWGKAFVSITRRLGILTFYHDLLFFWWLRYLAIKIKVIKSKSVICVVLLYKYTCSSSVLSAGEHLVMSVSLTRFSKKNSSLQNFLKIKLINCWSCIGVDRKISILEILTSPSILIKLSYPMILSYPNWLFIFRHQ